jgi:hypothetical protein
MSACVCLRMRGPAPAVGCMAAHVGRGTLQSAHSWLGSSFNKPCSSTMQGESVCHRAKKGHHDKEVDDRATQARPQTSMVHLQPPPHFKSPIDRSSNSGYDCLRQCVKRSTDNSSSDSTNEA